MSYFIVIDGDMIHGMGLKGNDLLTYSVINGFSQGKNGVFIGGPTAVAEMIGATKQGAINALKRLESAGMIERSGGGYQCTKKSPAIDKQGTGGELSSDIHEYHSSKAGRVKSDVLDMQIEQEIALNSSPELAYTLRLFVSHRKAIKKPMTLEAVRMTIKKLGKIADTDQEKIAILENSIANGWQGIFPIKPADRIEVERGSVKNVQTKGIAV